MILETPSSQSQTLPFVSVLIATRNRPEDLVYCLPTVLAQDYPHYEVLVLDQSSNDDSEQAVRRRLGMPAHLRYLRTDAVGKSRAVNRLMEEARGEILAFTDDDTVTPPDWLAKIVRSFQQRPEASILFGQVHYCEETLQQDKTLIATPCLYFEERRWLKHGEIFGMGANMAMRRAVAERGLRLDALLGPGMPLPAAEEGDFIYRVQRAGFQILLDPDVVLIHRAGRTEPQWLKIQYGYGLGDAAFAMKHLRCGDLSMLKKMFYSVIYISLRVCARKIQRRPHAESKYVRGYWHGLWRSLKLGIDRKTRLYRLPPGEGGPENPPRVTGAEPKQDIRKAV